MKKSDKVAENRGSRQLNAHGRSGARKRITGPCLCGIVTSLCGAGLACAQSDYWIQPAGGSWDSGANWSLGSPPGGNADFNLATGSPYTVTIGGPERLAYLNMLNNSVTINGGTGDQVVLAALNVNASAGQSSSFTFNGTSVDGADGSGFNATNGTIISPKAPGGVGGLGSTFLTFNDGIFINAGNPYTFGIGSTTVFSSAAVYTTMTVTGSLTLNACIGPGEAISVSGSGEVPAVFNVTGGSTISTYVYPVTIGNATATTPVDSTGLGIAYVSGAGSQLKTDQIGIGAPIGYLNDMGGTGTLYVSGGGEVVAVQIIDGSSTGTGTLNVNGSGSLVADSDTNAIAPGSLMQVSLGGKVTAVKLNMSTGSTLTVSLDEGGISISGLATLAGTLNVTLGTQPDPTLGETFDLITFGSETGTFSTIDLPPLDPGLGWNTQQLYTNGDITVIAIPEPSTLGMIATSIIWPLSRRKRRRQVIAQ